MKTHDFQDSIILNSTKSRTISDIGYNANCHGFTITGKNTVLLNWKELMLYSNNMGDKSILVYTYKHNISHSGRIVGKSFIHYIQKIGVVSTPLEVAIQLRTEFKDGAFILPIQREELFLHMKRSSI
ncbi:MAG: hypothetical protein OQL19_04135 [Gammaproteobacteria bacterium]|nr:hypothetical protein [Gammaproteobacteria bacterium]